MIYLLVIASLQALSMTISSNATAESAAQHAGQVNQMRSLEHLRVTLSRGGNVTISNDGLILSVLAVLLTQNSTISRQLSMGQQSLPVGSTMTLSAKPAGAFPSTVAVVTSLGNVFASSPASPSSSGGNWKTLQTSANLPAIDEQIFQNPADPSRFFLSAGSSVSAYSTARGTQLWSFDAGQGLVTDVIPLSDGTAYVSNGYYGNQFSSSLFRLTSSGTSVWEYTVRLFRLYNALESQFPDGDVPPTPVGSQPVEKGVDSLFAYYDGWFFSTAGPSRTALPPDSVSLATSDGNQFYLFTTAASPGFRCSQPNGNSLTFFAYSADSSGVQNQWISPTIFTNSCDYYPNELISSTAASGLVASIFSQTYWAQSTYLGGPYQGANPFLVVLSSSTGSTLRTGTLDSNGYSSLATDGARIYLSIPSLQEIEVLSASGSGGGTFYRIGISATKLIWSGSSLFAISKSHVKVFDASMNLKKSIDFTPQTFYSFANSKQLETQMVQPSFLVLNSTSYVALLRNSTGYGNLVLGTYSP